MREKRRKNPFAMRVGKRLRTARLALDMEQSEIAGKLGVSMEAYGSYERGWHPIPVEVLAKLPAVTHRPVAYFLDQQIDCELTDDEWMLLHAYRSIQAEDIKQSARDSTLNLLRVDERVRAASQEPA